MAYIHWCYVPGRMTAIRGDSRGDGQNATSGNRTPSIRVLCKPTPATPLRLSEALSTWLHLAGWLSVCLYLCLSVSVCLFVCLYVSICFCMSLFVWLFMSVCLFASAYLRLSVCLFVYLYVCLSVCQLFCLSISSFIASNQSPQSWSIRQMTWQNIKYYLRSNGIQWTITDIHLTLLTRTV